MPRTVFSSVEIPLENAAAMAGAVATRDPVTAVTSESEVSAPLMEFFQHPAEGRVSIYPIVVQEEVPALLYTWGDVNGAIVELLVQVATAVWMAIAAAAKPQPELVQIAAPPERPSPLGIRSRPRSSRCTFGRSDSPAYRLRKCGFTRRKRCSPAAPGVIYTRRCAGRSTARERVFIKRFTPPCPSMVDYFHLELVRTLANDDAELLGKDYPGPLA